MAIVGINRLGSGILAAQPPGPAAPLAVHSSRRYLVDANGVPFLGCGDAPWNLPMTLTVDQQTTYLRDRLARGVNMVLLTCIDNQFNYGNTVQGSTWGPNANGDLPFTTVFGGGTYNNAQTQSPDFSTPNAPYWTYLDATLNRVRAYGIVPLLYPSWIGNPGPGPGAEGFYTAMHAQSTGGASSQNMVNYGKFLANRYGPGGTNPIPNLIWGIGGDNTPADTTVNSDIATGITSVISSPIMYVDGLDGDAIISRWGSSTWMNANGIYTDQPLVHPYAYAQCKSEYQTSTGHFASYPQFWKEGAYEFTGSTLQFLRAQNWQAMLGGCWGFCPGVDGLWQFSAGWQGLLGSPSTVHADVLRAFMRARAWWLLTPDYAAAFLTNSGSYTNANYVGAARASDGSWGAMYTPISQSLVADLSGFRNNVTATWVDPTNGAPQSAGLTNGAASGSHTFASTPGSNAAGDADWVLVFTVAGT